MALDKKIFHLFGAGIVGAVLNIFVFWQAVTALRMGYVAAGVIGVTVNMVFNLFAQRLYESSRQSIFERPIEKFITALIAIILLNTALLWLTVGVAGFPVLLALILSIPIMSFFNFILNRVWVFASPHRAEVLYKEVPSNFYENQLNPKEVGWFRAWYHRTRYERLMAFVDKHTAGIKNPRIADLGCGSCNWNSKGLPVAGVDINKGLLELGIRMGRLAEVKEAPLDDTGLPESYFDVVVSAEVLEHILNFDAFLMEVRRILKPNGLLLITVPYDFFPSPFYLLFNIHCFVKGYILKDEYYKQRCGHINHFTKNILKKMLEEYDFKVREIFVVNGFLIYAAAERAERTGIKTQTTSINP